MHTPDNRTLNDIQREVVKDRLVSCRGQVTTTARSLGIGVSTLYRMMQRHEIDHKEVRSAAKSNPLG